MTVYLPVMCFESQRELDKKCEVQVMLHEYDWLFDLF